MNGTVCIPDYAEVNNGVSFSYLFYSYTIIYPLIDTNTLESIGYNNKTCNNNYIVNRHIGYSITKSYCKKMTV